MTTTQTKEHSIRFSDEMVRAYFAGRKTQTREPVKFPASLWFDASGYPFEGDGYTDCRPVEPGDIMAWITCPFGEPGDRLWVRECWYNDVPEVQDVQYVDYRATHDCRNWEGECPCRDADGRSAWRSSMHMPRWASRINLDVAAVRVEPLQEITEEDAVAEGVRWGTYEPHECRVCARGAFMDLWNSIYAKKGCGWDANPWVWVAEFNNGNR